MDIHFGQLFHFDFALRVMVGTELSFDTLPTGANLLDRFLYGAALDLPVFLASYRTS
jgi:hypothetical protein